MEITIKGIEAGQLEMTFELKGKQIEIKVTNYKGDVSKVNVPKDAIKNAIKAI